MNARSRREPAEKPAVVRYSADDTPSRALAAADPAMAAVIERAGCIEFGVATGTRFEVLVRAIAGQQLSGRAAWAIYGRLRDQIGLTPKAIATAREDQLLAAGLSHRKAEYVQGIARAVLDGDLDLDALDDLSDDDVIAMLSKLRGVGRWTSQMFLLFAMDRPDVLVVDDLGVRASAGHVLGLGRAATGKELEEAGERWKPYRSAATLYLYREGGGLPACVSDNARAEDASRVRAVRAAR